MEEPVSDSKDMSLARLADLRKRLLDLSFRNRLLHFPHSPRGKYYLRVVDELPNNLFNLLITQEQALAFKGLPVPETEHKREPRETAKSLGLNPEFEVPFHDGDNHRNHTDRFIQTLLYEDVMEATLNHICSKARLAIEETGANLLHVALGFLEWYDVETGTQRHAPLILIPVELEKSNLTRNRIYEFQLRYIDQDIFQNASLEALLARDFNLRLPEYVEGTQPETYFKQVQEMLTGDNRFNKWYVRRYITLGLFSFGRLQLYLDLDPARWKGSISQSSAVHQLFGELNGDADVVEPPEDHQASFDSQDLPIVCSADSSQYATLLEGARGTNMIIDGPPGTGKSQTISNLIAIAMAEGKTVLFLAEKLAALEVVASQLRDSGLGDFILELHSNKVKRKSVIESLRTRTQKQYSPAQHYEQAKTELKAVRGQLSEYARLAGQPVGDTGKNVHQILCAAARYRRIVARKYPTLEPQVRQEIPLAGIDFIPAVLTAFHGSVMGFIDILGQVDPPARALWTGVDPQNRLCHELRPCFQCWNLTLTELSEVCGEEPGLCGLADTLDDIRAVTRSIQELPEPGIADAGTFSRIKKAEEFKTLEDAIALELNFRRERDKAWCLRRRDENLESNQIVAGEQAFRALAEVFAGSMSLAEISECLEDLREIIQKTPKVQILRDAVLPLSHNEGLDLSARYLYRILDVVIGTPAPVLASRSDGFESSLLRRDVAVYAGRAAQLKTESVRIAERFILGACPSNKRLKELEDILVGSGLLSWFKPSFHRARREALLCLKGLKPSTIELIQHLRRVREFRDAQSEVDGLSDRLGIPQNQIEFQNEVCQWYEHQFLNLRPIELNAILRCPRDTLESLRVHASADIALLKRFEELADRLAKGPLGQTSVSQWPFAYEQLSKAIQTLLDLSLDRTTTLENVLELLQLSRAYGARASRLANDEVVSRLLGRPWQVGKESIESINATVQLLKWIERVDERLRRRFLLVQNNAQYTNLKEWGSRVAQRLGAVGAAETAAVSEANIDLCSWLTDRRLGGALVRLKAAVERIDSLDTWIQLGRARRDLEGKFLGSLARWLEQKEMEPVDAWEMVKYAAFQHTALDLYKKHPMLRTVSATSQAQLKRRLEQSDLEILELNRKQVAYNASLRNVPRGKRGGAVKELTQLALVEHEISKGTRYIPIRQLMARAGQAIRGLKPCLMMGPQGVAHYLLEGASQFDLVIIDEASQMRPEFALGAILRARQAVIVGDPQQLPPSDFFEAHIGEDNGDQALALEDSESILGAAATTFRGHELLWHYRSRHHTLIEFSNRIFYKNRLVVVPSSQPHSKELGIQYVEVSEGKFVDRKNVPEAEVVAGLAIEHMLHRPERSLAVVALNLEQAELIEDLIIDRVKDEPGAGDYVERHHSLPKPFIVKNLENIQGDERDSVIVSMTYGPNEDGRISSHFGPINHLHGERRLNVLFTRAKYQLTVVSSMQPEKLDVNSAMNEGPKILRDYLLFARDRQVITSLVSGREPDSDFEIEVLDLLREKGVLCDPQVGVMGFWIDIGVRDPKLPGKYVLGVECDGASYHSTRAARDRDLLRQQLLEGIGWKIHRIWSTDWFANPAKQIQNVLEVLARP